MNPLMLAILSAGLILNSALFLGFVAWLGVVWQAPLATLFAVAAMGLSYIGYSLQLAQVQRTLAIAVVLLSVIVGAAGGIVLLAHWLV